MNKIKVRLGSNSYEIRMGSGLLQQTGHWLIEGGFANKVVIITNPIVKGLYGDTLEQSLTTKGFKVATLQVPDGEEYKSLETTSRLYQELTDLNAERSTPILALGGGVIGDLAGFVAATYLRGVPLIQIPTTLLAQVDSSIGGKVAVDHGRLKNRIGSFYQPQLVIADTSTLRTQPPNVLVDGLAEVIKSAVIRDKELFVYLEEHLDAIKSLDEKRLEEIVFRSANIKAEVVAQDEKDLGLRSILNYGHTVGHAIETASNFAVGHGKAVAIGMVVAAALSNKLGIFAEDELIRLHTVIQRADLPTKIPDLKIEDIIQAMSYDKKIEQGRIRFILPRTIGEVFITDEVSPSLLKQVLVSYNEET